MEFAKIKFPVYIEFCITVIYFHGERTKNCIIKNFIENVKETKLRLTNNLIPPKFNVATLRKIQDGQNFSGIEVVRCKYLVVLCI